MVDFCDLVAPLADCLLNSKHAGLMHGLLAKLKNLCSKKAKISSDISQDYNRA